MLYYCIVAKLVICLSKLCLGKLLTTYLKSYGLVEGFRILTIWISLKCVWKPVTKPTNMVADDHAPH